MYLLVLNRFQFGIVIQRYELQSYENSKKYFKNNRNHISHEINFQKIRKQHQLRPYSTEYRTETDPFSETLCFSSF
jgi:hypothetical protein